MKKWNKYIYLVPGTLTPLMITAKSRPSEKSIPKCGSWIVREWYRNNNGIAETTKEESKWDIPCFPEITWGMVKTLIFVGKVKE
jgi:hypothetical protein